MTTTPTTTDTSPADELRSAASLMRERAEQATPGPWHFEPELFDGSTCAVISDSPNVELPWGALVVEPGMTEQARQDAGHIAGWHPTVALAVADWLDATADELDQDHLPIWRDMLDDAGIAAHIEASKHFGPPFRVARAYHGTRVEAVAR